MLFRSKAQNFRLVVDRGLVYGSVMPKRKPHHRPTAIHIVLSPEAYKDRLELQKLTGWTAKDIVEVAMTLLLTRLRRHPTPGMRIRLQREGVV